MATFASASKSNRLLQGKRYTIAELDAAEAYTRVFDLNASEIYTQEGEIISDNIPYSGSSQNGLYLTSNGQNISKFYYRFPLTPSSVKVVNNTKNNTFFFLSGSGFTPGISTTANPQIIQSEQQTNFISNKYADPTLASNNSENGVNDGGTAYNVVVSNDSKVYESTDYQFDYKTGILQFTSNEVSPTIFTNVYITVYQYLGKKLNEFITSAALPGGSPGEIQFNDGGTFGGDPRFIFEKTTGLTQLSGSLEITSSDNNIFLIKSGSIDLLRVSSSGAIVFGDLQHTPPPVVGGFFYSSSAFYVGVE